MLFVVCFSTTLSAQDSFNSLGETAFSVKHAATDNYNVDFTLRSRYFLYRNDNITYKQQQLDVYHLSSFTLNANKNIGLGVYYRNRNWFDSGSDELRFMQQYVCKDPRNAPHLSHRLRTEQRVFDTKTVYRQRYKIGNKIPLTSNNESSKTYLSTAIEALWSISKQIKGETDIRITALIIWPALKQLKLKTGLEHRLEAFNLNAKNYLFVLTSASLKI